MQSEKRDAAERVLRGPFPRKGSAARQEDGQEGRRPRALQTPTDERRGHSRAATHSPSTCAHGTPEAKLAEAISDTVNIKLRIC